MPGIDAHDKLAATRDIAEPLDGVLERGYEKVQGAFRSMPSMPVSVVSLRPAPRLIFDRRLVVCAAVLLGALSAAWYTASRYLEALG
jgi:hypothetical protein